MVTELERDKRQISVSGNGSNVVNLEDTRYIISFAFDQSHSPNLPSICACAKTSAFVALIFLSLALHLLSYKSTGNVHLELLEVGKW